MIIYIDNTKTRHRPQTGTELIHLALNVICCFLWGRGGGGGVGSGVESPLPCTHPNTPLLSSLPGVNTLSIPSSDIKL